MPNNAGTVPTFSGKTSLSLSDLDALSDAVNSLHGTEYVPASPHRGSRKYGLANYNAAEVDNNPGIISSVGYESGLTSPKIEAGAIKLPPGGCGGSCSCVPAEYNECSGSVLGLIRSIDPNLNIQQPDIVDGAIRLPYADTARGAQGIMQGVQVVEGFRNPLICFGHLFLPLADTCSGATGLINGVATDASTSPYIDAGVLHLTDSACSCVPAEYNGSTSTLGLIRSIDPSINVSKPDICDGAIRLPYAHSPASRLGLMKSVSVMEDITSPLICYGMLWLPLANGYSVEDACGGSTVCGGNAGLISGIQTCAGLSAPLICAGVINLPASSSGDLLGVRDVYGNGIPWASVNNTVLSTHYVGSYKYDLKATYDSGFLCLQIIQDYGES